MLDAPNPFRGQRPPIGDHKALLRRIGAALAIVSFCITKAGAIEPLRVAAAISLRETLTAIATDYERREGVRVELTFGSSGQLMTQIRNGAPYDVFISAARAQVDSLTRESLVAPDTERLIARNQLVLTAAADATGVPSRFEELPQSDGKIAIGDPETVPAGQYALETLKSLKLEPSLQARLVFGANVRQVLAYVEQGAAPLGIVYATDAKLSGDKVRVVAQADENWHSPIDYPACVLRSSKQAAAARRFLDFFDSDAARGGLKSFGFIPATGASRAPSSAPAAAP